MDLDNRKIIVGVCGGIAAYKAADLCSLLKKAGAEVRVAMTRSATQFVAPLTFETLTNSPVYIDVFERERAYDMEHISWSKWGDTLVVAPATANMIAKMANGIANDAISTLYLTFRGRVLVAPAMNTQMLEHPATQNNLKLLAERGARIIQPDSGMLACGDVGAGKLAAPQRIVQALGDGSIATAALIATDPSQQAAPPAPLPSVPLQVRDNSLAGKKVLITSGPTHEYLDPVRFITNPSSGKMGLALAREAAMRGAEVHFVTGPVSPALLPTGSAKIYRITSAEQMLRSVTSLAPAMDIMIFAAAVSDFRAAIPVNQKIKRTGNSITLPLLENPDISQAIGHAKRPGQITVGFAAETQDLQANAQGKLERKRLDAIVANNVADPRIGFERDENEVTIFLRDGSQINVSRRAKSEVAYEVFEAILSLKTIS